MCFFYLLLCRSVFCEHCKQTVCLFVAVFILQVEVCDKHLTLDKIERLLCESDNEITDENFVLPTNLVLNGNSESSRGSESDESKEQRRYIYDRLAHHNNILTPNPFVCDSAINGDIIQNFSQNSVLKEIYIIN